MKQYVGIRTENGCKVTVNGRPLALRLDLWNHSPSGFEWGYGGSGPAQLGLAILANYFRVRGMNSESANKAVRLHQLFKRAVIAKLPHEKWILTEEEVKGWVYECAKDFHYQHGGTVEEYLR